MTDGGRDSVDDLATVTKRSAVGKTLHDYVWAVDRKDLNEVKSIIAPDARVRYGAARPWMDDIDSVIEFLSAHVDGVEWQCHTVVVENVDLLDGSNATARASLSAYQKTAAEPNTLMTVLGRYHVRLRRDENRWRIIELDLDIGWVDRRSVDGCTAYL